MSFKMNDEYFSVPSCIDSIDGLSFDSSFLEGSLDRFCEVPEQKAAAKRWQVVYLYGHFDDFC